MHINDTVLIVVDVQGKLASLMFEHERMVANIERIIKITRILEIPVLWTEQAPDKIGPTVGPVSQLLFPLVKPMPKRAFSCYACAEFKEHINGLRRRQVLLAGIEAHVCVYQTARDLCRHGYEVYLAADAVSSRAQGNKDIAVERMAREGIIITSVEMAACELLGSADHPKFRDVMANIKR
ncbi:MAG: hydrolase [Candidatus Omnitrophica bacterium]|nr:hydrolase [Candidatus Omnitrophota bacterium]